MAWPKSENLLIQMLDKITNLSVSGKSTSSRVLSKLKPALFQHEMSTYAEFRIVFPEPLLSFLLLTPQNFQVGFFGFMQIKMVVNRIDF